MRAFHTPLSMRFIMDLIWAPGPSSNSSVLPAATNAFSVASHCDLTFPGQPAIKSYSTNQSMAGPLSAVINSSSAPVLPAANQRLQCRIPLQEQGLYFQLIDASGNL